MRIQTVKFPSTPELTLEKINEMRPLIDAYYKEVEGGDTSLQPGEMLAIMWHSGSLDFVEALENDERVGLMMIGVYRNEINGKSVASVMSLYVKPEYRKKGIATMMLDYLQKTLVARRIDCVEMIIRDGMTPIPFGKEVGKVYRQEL